MPVAAANPFDQFDVTPPPVRPSPTVEEPSTARKAWDFYKNYLSPATIIEPAANLATNMVATPLAGLSGLTQRGLNAAGIDQTAPAEAVRQVQERLTYQPQTGGGQMVSNALAYPFQKLAQGADWVGDKLNNPLLMIPTPYGMVRGGPEAATIANTAIQAAPSLFLKGPKGSARAATVAAEIPKPGPVITPRQALVGELSAKGLKVTPTQAGKSGGAVVEGLAGAAKLERAISLKNAKRVNELAGEDLGLKGAKEITQADLNRLKVEANKGYAEIAKTGERKTSPEYRQEIESITDRTGGDSFAGDVPADIVKLKDFYAKIKRFDARDAVNKIRQLRADATKNIKAINAPEQNAKGYVQRQIADALDNELQRHAESLGKPELAANYKAARVQLAKIHTLEDALDGSNVSAAALAKAKDRGAPLSGNMDLIARASTEFDRSFQNVNKIRDGSPFSVLDLGAGVVGATASPALTAAVIARPAARAILASDAYQRRLASGVEKPRAKNDGATKEALARPAVAAAPRKEQRK